MSGYEPLPRERAEELIAAAKRGDRDAAETLVKANIALVRSVALRYRLRAEQDDLVQIGCMGLLKAIRGFEPAYGVCFSTYAVPMIAGEIKRFLRDDGMVKVSRRLKEINAKAVKCAERIAAEKGRAATVEELAAELELEPSDVTAAMEAACPMRSIDEPAYCGGAETTLGDTLCGADSMEERAVERVLTAELLAGLDEREREIIMLRYFRGRTQAETAAALGLTQVKVSRMESGIIKELKKRAGVGG